MIKLINKSIAIRYGQKTLLITLDKSWGEYPSSQFVSPNANYRFKIYNLGLFLLVFISKGV